MKMNFDKYFIEICSQVSNYASIGSGNGLASNRRQAIACTDFDPVHWHVYAGDELNKFITMTS